MNQLSKRARSILYAVVTEFIATGEPVGSRTVAKKFGLELSAATIRNVLADLEDAGYLAQPHTSAGRVPTAAAYRLFIDALMQVRELPADDAARIAEHFEELHPGADLMRETGRLLSEMTGAAAVMVRPRVESRTLLKLRFIPTRPGELLSVLVLSDGSVENRFIVLERGLGSAELERLHNLLEEMAEGRTLVSVRDHLAERLAAHKDELSALRDLGVSLLSAAIDGADRSTEVVIEGRSRLLEHRDLQTGPQVGELMRVLEDTEHLIALLDRTLVSERVQVFLGGESDAGETYPLSVVAAPYRDEAGRPGGVVGIIGPERMDYPTVVPLVGATAGAVSAALARSQGSAAKPTK